MKTYEEVASAAGLAPETASRFARYMRTRWPEQEQELCETDYAAEWAVRFRESMEYVCSDSAGRAVLRMIDEEKTEGRK